MCVLFVDVGSEAVGVLLGSRGGGMGVEVEKDNCSGLRRGGI